GYFCHYLLSINREYWSYAMLTFLVTNIPINVYLTSRFMMDSMDSVEIYIMLVIFVLENIVFVLVLLPLALLSKLIHRPRKILFKLQSLIPASLLTTKLKYDLFYHRLS